MVAGMEADLRRLPAGAKTEDDPVARLAGAARALVRDQRERVRLLRGSSPLVDGLEDSVAALEHTASTAWSKYASEIPTGCRSSAAPLPATYE